MPLSTYFLSLLYLLSSIGSCFCLCPRSPRGIVYAGARERNQCQRHTTKQPLQSPLPILEAEELRSRSYQSMTGIFVARNIRICHHLKRKTINSLPLHEEQARHNYNHPSPNLCYARFRNMSTATTTTTTSQDFPPAKVQAIASEIAGLLKERNETISLAETAAGGIVSSSLLAQPGASKFYRGGLVLYTLESRTAFAGWTQENTTSYRGPTPSVVSGLAKNVSATLGATYTLCESGTAGPTGGNTPNRTPGYVALAVVTDKGEVFTKELDTGLGTDRQANMVAFAHEGLLFLKDVITGGVKAEGEEKL